MQGKAYSPSYKDPKVPIGPQTPNKYGGRVGANYLHYGEQPGYIYNPADDMYYIDQRAAEQYAKDTGQYKKQPGIVSQIAPLAAAAGASALASGVAKSVTEDQGGLLNGIANLFGLGNSPEELAKVASSGGGSGNGGSFWSDIIDMITGES